jgi:hypothetical protein
MLTAEVRGRPARGDYVLQIDLVQEFVVCFRDKEPTLVALKVAVR